MENRRIKQGRAPGSLNKKTGDNNPGLRLDLAQLGVQFCPAGRAEKICKDAVFRELSRRAKAAGKKILGGTGSIVGANRCHDVRWLLGTLEEMGAEFALLIEEDLEELKKPGAERERLVGQIFTNILCIGATTTIIVGD